MGKVKTWVKENKGKLLMGGLGIAVAVLFGVSLVKESPNRMSRRELDAEGERILEAFKNSAEEAEIQPTEVEA